MTDLPFHLLEHLASRGEQVRFISGATKGEYLLPEELLNDAYHFCERAKRAEEWSTLSESQRSLVEGLEAAIGAMPDDFLASPTIVDDEPWVAIVQQAGDILRAFGRDALR